MSTKLLNDLCMNINSIEVYNNKLAELYLDIERQPIEELKKIYKQKCYKIIESMNVQLSPYHWEIEKTCETVRDRIIQCYLLILTTGEDKMINEIKEM